MHGGVCGWVHGPGGLGLWQAAFLLCSFCVQTYENRGSNEKLGIRSKKFDAGTIEILLDGMDDYLIREGCKSDELDVCNLYVLAVGAIVKKVESCCCHG